MTTFPKTVFYYGAEKPITRPVALRAGPVTMVFEPDTAVLRHVRLGDHEVCRAIYAAVRDQNWATIRPQITNFQSEIEKDHFKLTFDVHCQNNQVEYFWRGQITGTADGRITYSFDGESKSEFLRNRIGICVLHPITECAGKPVTIEHDDGAVENGTFPKEIAPNQPFKEIRVLSYEVQAGIRAEFRFEGEIFEMEDQRNWCDASFKTYCMPLRIPIPVAVKPGDKVHHVCTLSVTGVTRPILPVVQGRPVQISIATTPAYALPPIGFCVARDSEPLTAKQIERLKILRPAHLRVDLKLPDASDSRLLERAVNESRQLGAPLHMAATVNDNAPEELKGLRALLDQFKPRVSLWLIFHEKEESTRDQWLIAARDALQSYAPNVLFSGGTLDWFTEINRNRPSANAPWFTCYSLNPQVHAFDNTTLVENLEAQAFTVDSARRLSSKPVIISPITLRMRDKGQTAMVQGRDRSSRQLPSDVDPRQMSLFGAGWTIGSIARLAMTGHVHSLTYFETAGWRGLMNSEFRIQNSEFGSDAVFPMYHVFADIAEFGARQIYGSYCTHPLRAEALTLVDGKGRRRILVGNLTGDTQEIKIKSGASPGRMRVLDETNVEQAMGEPEVFRELPDTVLQPVTAKLELTMLPYALARIDID
jgi:hypothetical protein